MSNNDEVGTSVNVRHTNLSTLLEQIDKIMSYTVRNNEIGTSPRSSVTEDGSWVGCGQPGDDTEIPEDDIHLVMEQADVSRDEAIISLIDNDGDIVEAILSLVNNDEDVVEVME
jgi:NACalpha-BTF3-like transcription factor